MIDEQQAAKIADLTQANTQMQTALLDIQQENRLLKDVVRGLRQLISLAPANSNKTRSITVSESYVEWLNKLNLD
jgi:hypothetical protein